MRMSADPNHVSVLFLFSPSAAFHAIDHSILTERLKKWVGLSGTVLDWFRSYLPGRKFFEFWWCCIMNFWDWVECSSRKCFGSYSLFFVYASSEQHNYHNVKYRCYVDDTRLYIFDSPNNPRSLNTLFTCLSDINNLMNHIFYEAMSRKWKFCWCAENQKGRNWNRCFLTCPTRSEHVTDLGVISASDLFHKPF